MTLTDSDLLTDTQELDIIVGSTGPTPPTPYIFPENPLESEDLVCGLLPGTVGPGLTAQYEYEWSNGTTTLPIRGPKVSLTDILEASHTSAGDVWTCRARTFDGTDRSDWSDPAESDVIRGLGESVLSLQAVPDSLTLGQYVILTGSITPTVAGENVFFDGTQTPAGGTDTKPPTMVTNSFGAFTHTFLPDEAGNWNFHAEWSGNDQLTGDSVAAAVAVGRAQPTLSLELNASSVAIGFAELDAAATLNAPIPAQLDAMKEGLTLNLWIKKPDATAAGPVTKTTAEGGCATFMPSDFAGAGVQFNEPGLWQFLVEFEGNDAFLPAVSTGYDEHDSVGLTIKDRAGYAILVLGKLNHWAEGHRSHARTLDFVYRTFRHRGFSDHVLDPLYNDIYYFRGGDPPAADILVDDDTPTEAELEDVIQTWACDKLNETAAPLYLVFADHGRIDEFYLYAGVYDDTRIIEAGEVAGWLANLEAGLDAEALEQDIIFVYGACHSGSCIDDLSGPHRTIITSCMATEASHRGVFDRLFGVRDGEVFVTEFFRQAREGKTLKASFELASDKVANYTHSRSNWLWGERTQHPVLDDNGDGVGTTGELSFLPGEDGAVAHQLVLGYGVNEAGTVGWITVSQTVSLDEDDPMPTLEAKCTEAPADGLDAWLEIKAPGYTGSTAADPEHPEGQQEIELRVFDYDAACSDLATGWFRWCNPEPAPDEPTYQETFAAPGTYQVYFYVEDSENEDTSAYMMTTVYRAAPGNLPPDPVTLELPEDGTEVHSTVFFAWQKTTDPDGDAVTYRLEVAEDDAFTVGLITKEGIQSTVAQLTEADGIVDGQTYYWRAVPVDVYGASPDDNEVRTFLVNNDNDMLDGTFTGLITDAYTDEPIPNALVQVPSIGLSMYSDEAGEYYFQLQPRYSYVVEASASFYLAQSKSISLTAGQIVFLNFQLDVEYVEGDWIRNPANGHYYKLIPPMTWEEARALTQNDPEYDGYLTTIIHAPENAWVHGVFGPAGDFFIGLYDPGTGEYAWHQGDATFRNWIEEAPGGSASPSRSASPKRTPGLPPQPKASPADPESSSASWTYWTPTAGAA